MNLYKTQLLFLVLTILIVNQNVNAQINLTNIAIGVNSNNPKSSISINSDGSSDVGISVTDVDINPPLKTGIQSYLTRPTTVDWKYAVTGSIDSGFGNAIGLFGSSSTTTPSNEGRAYGLFAQAGNATPNYNYAVYGSLVGSNAGAAIFGWDRVTYPNTSVLNTQGFWAGYFVGKTRFTQQIQIDAGGIKFPDGTVQTTASGNALSRNALNQQQKIIEDLLVEKRKQQQKVIQIEGELQEQAEEIATLKALVNEILSEKSTNTSTVDLQETTKYATLAQNFPNPFSEETIINYFVPNSTHKAMFLLSSLDGKEIQRFEVSKGANQLKLKTNSLSKGAYFYSLIIDGNVVESKQLMIK